MVRILTLPGIERPYLDEKLAKASACYVVCYQYEQAQHPKRILSFPWLFSRLLVQLRQRNLAVMAKGKLNFLTNKKDYS